jgi:MFS family permease
MTDDSRRSSSPSADKKKRSIIRALRNDSLHVIVLALMVQAMVVAAALAPTVIAPTIASAFGLPVSTIGIFISIVYAGAICSSLCSGAFIAMWGPIRCSQVGLGLCASGLALIASGVTWLGMAGAVLIGLGYGPITPASSHILIRTTRPRQLSTVFSIKQTGVPLGGVFVGLLVPPQEIAFGWEWAILSMGIGCVAMIFIAQPLRRRLDMDRPTYPRQSFLSGMVTPIRLVASHPALRNLTGCSFVFSGLQFSLFTYLSAYLNLGLKWSLLAAGVAVSVVQGAGMAGRLIWGAISDHGLGARRTLALLTVLMLAGSIAVANFSVDMHHFLVFAVLIAFGASAVGWNGVYLAEVARLAPTGKAGMATGGSLALTFAGIVFWTPLFGLLADATGGYRASYLSACVPLSICLAILWNCRFHRNGME